MRRILWGLILLAVTGLPQPVETSSADYTMAAGSVDIVLDDAKDGTRDPGTVLGWLPAWITFDDDVPGQPPATGGVNQPTLLKIVSGTSIEVRAGANGIDNQPVVLDDGGTQDYVSVDYYFSPPVSSQVLRVEATMSIDRFIHAYFLQTTLNKDFPAVVSRLRTVEDGRLQSAGWRWYHRRDVGTYTPGEPFRVRMDIDMQAGRWSCTVDSEMNGFADDPVVRDLRFSNRPERLPSVGGVNASLNVFRSTPPDAPTTVAYDDISITVVFGATLDIKPGSDPNSVNPRARGRIPVALLGSESFDVTTVDVLTLRFGPLAASPAHSGHVEDVNGDGHQDLVAHFSAWLSGIACDTTEATLTGMTHDGTPIEATDSVRPVGCRSSVSPVGARRSQREFQEPRVPAAVDIEHP